MNETMARQSKIVLPQLGVGLMYKFWSHFA